MRTILVLLAISILVAGCQPSLDVFTNTTNQTATPTNETVQTQPPLAPDEPPVTTTPTTPSPPPVLDVPQKIDLLLNNLEVRRTEFGEQERHTLTMILTAQQHQRITSGSLVFTPLCNENIRLIITINNDVLYDDTPRCGEEKSVDLPKRYLNQGPNIISFSNKVTMSYLLADIMIVFVNDDGTTEELPGRDHVFEPPTTRTTRSVHQPGIVTLNNYVERTFRISEQDLRQGLSLSLDGTRQEGTLMVLLNGHLVYEGLVRSRAQTIALPEEHLLIGTNTLTFIGKE